jgi:gamma-glutamylcyclotransferase (GGCT)/AIG2-like uncharacterized protein YtfP
MAASGERVFRIRTRLAEITASLIFMQAFSVPADRRKIHGALLQMRLPSVRIMADTSFVSLAVNGTLMRGLELNPNMLAAGAEFLREDRTEPAYRLFSIGDRHPGMFRIAQGGASVAVEVWRVPAPGLSAILQHEPPGVLAEQILCEGQKEITQFGGWRAYRDAAKRGEG